MTRQGASGSRYTNSAATRTHRVLRRVVVDDAQNAHCAAPAPCCPRTPGALHTMASAPSAPEVAPAASAGPPAPAAPFQPGVALAHAAAACSSALVRCTPSDLTALAHWNVISASVGVTFAALAIILPWARMTMDVPATQFTRARHVTQDTWPYGLIQCEMAEGAATSSCAKLAATAFEDAMGADVGGRLKSGSDVAASFSIMNLIFTVALVAAWVLSFRRMGGVDACGARASAGSVQPTRRLVEIMLALQGMVALWAIVAFAGYADKVDGLRSQVVPEGATFTYSAGFAFEVLLFFHALVATALTYAFWLKLRAATPPGSTLVTAGSVVQGGAAVVVGNPYAQVKRADVASVLAPPMPPLPPPA